MHYFPLGGVTYVKPQVRDAVAMTGARYVPVPSTSYVSIVSTTPVCSTSDCSTIPTQRAARRPTLWRRVASTDPTRRRGSSPEPRRWTISCGTWQSCRTIRRSSTVFDVGWCSPTRTGPAPVVSPLCLGSRTRNVRYTRTSTPTTPTQVYDLY